MFLVHYISPLSCACVVMFPYVYVCCYLCIIYQKYVRCNNNGA